MNANYKIFVINLNRSIERWEKIRANLDNLNLAYERFPAIDGKSLSDEMLQKYYSEELNRKHYFTSLKKTEIACYISHIEVYKKILNENLDFAIILEDDVVLKKSFTLAPKALISLMGKWEYVKLIVAFRKKKIVEQVPFNIQVSVGVDIENWKSCDNGSFNLSKENRTVEIPFEFDLVTWQKAPAGTQAYAISKEGAKKFLENRKVFYRPIDVDLQFAWESNFKVQGLLPELCELSEVESEIGSRRKYKAHFPFARLVHKLKYALAAYRHKRSLKNG